jgi:hypothetical protein
VTVGIAGLEIEGEVADEAGVYTGTPVVATASDGCYTCKLK